MKSRHTIGLALGALLLGGSALRVFAGEEPVQNTNTSIAPRSKGFLKVNGLELYHEVYGKSRGGEPALVVLHGGLMTIPEMMPVIEPLSRGRKVVALELQGHGRTADTDRPLEFSTLGDDVAEVIDQLELGQPDLAGYSFGADVALRAAIQHPDKVRRLIVISTPFALRGWYPEVQQQLSEVSHTIVDSLAGTPIADFASEWPEPERFATFLDKMGETLGEPYDWSEEVKKLPMPVLLMYGDHDSVSQAHIAEFFGLLGGGVSEPGWQNTKFTRARLSIVPGYSHYDLMSSPEVPYTLAKYLADPLDGSASGAPSTSAP